MQMHAAEATLHNKHPVESINTCIKVQDLKQAVMTHLSVLNIYKLKQNTHLTRKGHDHETTYLLIFPEFCLNRDRDCVIL